MNGGTMNRKSDSSVASSNARAKGTSGNSRVPRHPGSTPNAAVQMLSKVKRRRMFWRSAAAAAADSSSSSGSSLRRRRSVTVPAEYAVNRAECISAVAARRCSLHSRPSALKMPSPRKSANLPSLGEIGKARLEDVLDDGRVGGHDAIAAAEPHAAVGEGAAAAGGGVGHPVVGVVAVDEESRDDAEYGPQHRALRG
ncbi:hypothetical protein ACMD2_24882 [Ananas comosus]|uniref:Uncharacterized protein n=1 Tax=Ananas comosus TaxID=4615 RepID=A0A199V9X3_ANACO|nr:hypothetical protein ACMD2_24882 [Ananas comosus]